MSEKNSPDLGKRYPAIVLATSISPIQEQRINIELAVQLIKRAMSVDADERTRKIVNIEEMLDSILESTTVLEMILDYLAAYVREHHVSNPPDKDAIP